MTTEHKFFYPVSDFAGLDAIREYIIKDWLLAHGLTWIIAKRGLGKSTLALDIGCHLAAASVKDSDWQGIPIQKDWCVIYICGEDKQGMILNLRAWAEHNGGLPADDRLLVTDGTIRMTNDETFEARIKEMKKWVNGRKCLIILDTWQRSLSGAQANDQSQMDTAIEVAEHLAVQVGGPMLICCHPPKSGQLTIRGSAVQEDTSSGLWEMEPTDRGFELTNARIKGRGKNEKREFNIKVITLPGEERDYFGEPLQGIVPICIAGSGDTPHTKAERAQADADVWGALVRLVMQSVEPDGNHIRYTCNYVTLQGAAMLKDAESRLCADWLPIAEAAGFHESRSESTIRRALDKHFFPKRGRGRHVDFEDGARLSVTNKKTRKGEFVIGRNPLYGTQELSDEI